MSKIDIRTLKIKERVLIENSQLLLPNCGIVVIRGNNGIGKSTLAHYLHTEIKSSTLMNQSNSRIIASMSIHENILFGQKNRNLDILLSKYSLETLIDKEAASLSGGEARLISLLRAMMSPNSLVILDEPTSDIDQYWYDIMMSIIEEFSTKKCVIIITHDLRITQAKFEYKIENQKIFPITLDEIDHTPIKEQINFPTLSILKKKNRFKKLILTIFLGVIFVYCSNMFYRFKPEEIHHKFNHELLIVQHNSEYFGAVANEGALPILSIVECASKLDVEKCMERAYSPPLSNSFTPLILKGDYKITPMEFLISDQQSISYEGYLENLFGLENGVISRGNKVKNMMDYINNNLPSEVVEIDKAIIGADKMPALLKKMNEMKLDYVLNDDSMIYFPHTQQLYQLFVEEYHDFPYISAYLSDFNDRVFDLYNNSIGLTSSTFVLSNETNQIVKEAQIFTQLLILVKQMLIVVISAILLFSLTIFIVEKNFLLQNTVLYDYGIPHKKVVSFRKKEYRSVYLYIVLLIMIGINFYVSIYLYKYFVYLLISVVLLLSYLIMVIFKDLIIDLVNKKNQYWS